MNLVVEPQRKRVRCLFLPQTELWVLIHVEVHGNCNPHVYPVDGRFTRLSTGPRGHGVNFRTVLGSTRAFGVKNDS